ncbi:RagB/SusD family nutrient uptake outer membrane protein [Flavobacterium sp. F-380]|uniref:RagB/SusD family nutrient uptake outer membrane protein n=1 Tax=Flavobacterium kayseriense TaxID=2764714 RepID=A0ABR7J974_9FLAO|nr:RagB/SusD family nutrient uptake outer membrane protein [Flavobacterium kayseriense]MBC5842096.1 RagB/SusD family nutrient uptake outer membrane protein [Flavobacterium kayseriense]MBC5848626.1 RagB/SusD family nutrient uptake outer membrane protein [Flavobacterium kayseriense]
MKHKVIIVSLILSGFFVGCQDLADNFLDAPAISTLDESVIFSTPGLAKGAIDGIKIPFAETNSYRGRFLPFYGLNTDTEWLNTSQTAGDNADLCVYDTKPNNTNMNTTNNAWAMMYSGIERANICIRGLRAFGNPNPGNELGQLLGEALTLRAIYYADLIKAWGDVPARFEPINSETLYLPKSSRDEIYKRLIQDLGEAATLVAWPNQSPATATVERINKAFVKAFRARLAMAASGFQQYPDGVRRSNDSELSVAKMYKLALDETREVMQSGTARLESSFETLWRKYNEENIAAGGESLWELPFAEGRGRMLFTFAVRHTTSDQFHANGNNRGGVAGPLPTVFYDFDEVDTRRDVSCVPYRYGTAVNGIAKQELGRSDTWYFGKYRYEWTKRFITSTNDDGINKMYMRYAEVLFIAAEAANELEGATAAAPYLKEIRRRAFATQLHPVKVDAYVNNLISKQAMFDAIVKEHKYEFTGEMERKQALIRWNLLKNNLDEAKAKMTNLQNRTGEYADVPTTLYYKFKADNVSLTIYGLNRGEIANPGPDYSAFSWQSLVDTKVNSLYKTGVNPDNRQFWPIWQVFIDGSNGKLVNDYGY